MNPRTTRRRIKAALLRPCPPRCANPRSLRVVLVLSATVVVLVGMHMGASILNPIYFAVVLALLFIPIYSWLGRGGIPKPLALVIMLMGLAILFLGLFFISASGP
jgi:AI-2 transport protein TqsA